MHMLPYDAQLAVEHRYSRKNIRKYVRDDIQSCKPLMDAVSQGVSLLIGYLMQDPGYASKQQRLWQLQQQLDNASLEEWVLDVLTVVMVLEQSEKLTQLVGMTAHIYPLANQIDQLKTAAEVLAVLCQADLFDIARNEYNELLVVPKYRLDDKVVAFIRQTQYLPPMLCPPRKLVKNWQSGYLTFDDSLILKRNHHEDDICLDSLNLFNSVPLSLKVDMLKTVSEVPTFVFKTPEQQQQWHRMVTDSYQVYLDLVAAGNRFYLTHKVDKRGRTYCQGYHVSYQGNKFRQAIVELADKRKVTGC